LESENATKISSNKPDNWHWQLKEMIDSESLSNFCKNKAFLTFNYDRSLDQVLFNMINAYEVSEEQKREHFSTIPIIHLHGQIAFLPHQKDKRKKYGSHAYGKHDFSEYSLAAQTTELRITYENFELEKETNLKLANHYISKAKTILFIGFAYDEYNLDRLNFGNSAQIYGTAFGLDRYEQTRVKDYFKKRHNKDINFFDNNNPDIVKNIDAAQFLKNIIDTENVNKMSKITKKCFLWDENK
ncbi:MAG: hypothetical protein GY858_08770, partial [Candidatus Omnitrophica bacterium]|nr:hypothetical protein [Candidatus Omnitrophota bacterium]